MGSPPLFSSSRLDEKRRTLSTLTNSNNKHLFFQAFLASVFLLLLALTTNTSTIDDDNRNAGFGEDVENFARKIDAQKLMKQIQNQHGGAYEDEDSKKAVNYAVKLDILSHDAELKAIKLMRERDALLRALDANDKNSGSLDEFAGEDSSGFGMSSVSGKSLSYKKMSKQVNLCNEDGTNVNCPKRANVIEEEESSSFPKVFVYDVPKQLTSELAKRYGRCERDQYGTEIWFHRNFRDDKNGVRTMNPEEADLFFVPQYGECFLWSREMLRHENQGQAMEETNEYFLEVLSHVKGKLPYFNRTDGRDHIFVFAGARGPTIFRDWQKEIPHSIYLTPEGDRTLPQFDTWKDIVIPGLEYDKRMYLEEHRNELVMNPPKRKILAMFRGTIDHPAGFAYSKGLRPKLKKIFQNATDVIYDTKIKDCDRDCYVREMTESVFCLNPLGWTPWTLRFYQAVMTRCIPIIIADNIEFPFESEINYSEFALKIPEKDVSDILETMRDMPEEERERRRRYMDKIWKQFTYQRPAEIGDAYYSTVKELARKVRAHKKYGRESFW
ncbi:unnamed protein product [Bathycoccus prasinos]